VAARIKTVPEDFVVEEIPAYEPSGQGDHLFVRFTKRGLTTEQALRALAAALGANARDAGIAGQKDKIAVTTQTASFLAPRGVGVEELEARARRATIPDVTVLDARPHGHKLKPGHLAGNRFALRVRGLDRAEAERGARRLDEIARTGLPNSFGSQRYGARGDNAERAKAWLSGAAPAPRDPRLRRLLFSALQARVFDAVLEARVREGTWATPLEGDLLKRRTSGGLFVCTDVQTDRARALEGEVSPTGPIFGVKMRAAEGVPGALEHGVMAEILGSDFDLASTRRLGEGSRRALRLWIDAVRVEAATDDLAREDGNSLWVYFVLPKGAYATTVLASVFAIDDRAKDPETLHEAGEEDGR
jgi:tRNA pseudouridine13 synthase